MIETVIKRDGREEPFDPTKIMGWAEWTGKGIASPSKWWHVVVDVIGRLPNRSTTKDITRELIAGLAGMGTWAGQLMAGRLYAIECYYDIFGAKAPIAFIDNYKRLVTKGFYKQMSYSDGELLEVENIINHDRDQELPKYALEYSRKKYAVQNRDTREVFESQQQTYMRLALFVMDNYTEGRMEHVRNMYELLSDRTIGAPTPNFTSMGTNRAAAVSCVLYCSGDAADSISAANHIAENCVTVGAGLGGHMNLRGPNDPVRGGEILHEGRFKYYRAQSALATQNKQGARAGALTMYFDIFNTEVQMLLNLRNPRTPEARRNRLMHYSVIYHPEFVRRAFALEKFATFNVYHEPELWNSMFSKDQTLFVKLYAEYMTRAPKERIHDAREIYNMLESEIWATGTVYDFNAKAVNSHTPMKEPITQSNLCAEITEVTIPYVHTKYLYDETDHGKGEIATCNLGSVNVAYLPITPENEAKYARAAEYSLRMVDSAIMNARYPFPHMNFTARQRMYAGVGIHGFATLLAGLKIKPGTEEFYQLCHQVAERHMYHLIKASIKLSKERGLAPWMHKTLWPEGWTPKATYERNVDEIANFTDRYDWEALSAEIIANGGIGHSLLFCIMPGESSTKPMAVPNATWRVREDSLNKTDGGTKIDWMAPGAGTPDYEYTYAWDESLEVQVKTVAIFQKWADQSISFEKFRRIGKAEKIPMTEIARARGLGIRYGVKTSYYANTNTYTDNNATNFITAFNRPFYDEETMKSLLGKEAAAEAKVICEGCDA